MYIIPIEKSSSVFYNLDRHILLIFPCVDTHTGCAGICGYFFLCSIVSEQLWQLSVSLADIHSRLLKIIQKKGKKS